MLPTLLVLILFDFLLDISKVVFIEVVSFQRNRAFVFSIVIYVMVAAVSLEDVSG